MTDTPIYTPEQLAEMRAILLEHDEQVRAANQAALDAKYQPVVSIVQSPAFTELRPLIADAVTALAGQDDMDNFRQTLKAVNMCIDNLSTMIQGAVPHLLVTPEED